MRTRRRAFLATCGAVLGGTAGCLGDGGGSSTPVDTDDDDDDADDGYAPDGVLPDDPPEAADFDPASFDTVTTDGVEVPLVPIETAYNWFQRQDARFADARGSTQYQRSHVPGAVHSPAPDGGDGSDPVADWPDDARIVTYCGCPHHLSSQRAATLIDGGRDSVFAIDEGFRRDNGGWLEKEYPVAGDGQSSQAYIVSGRTNPADVGEYARAEHGEGSQLEAAPIQADGSYEMTLHFSGLTPESLLTIQTPSYEVTKSLAEVTGSVVTGE